ncbi:MAG: SEC-C domain-containing protein [Polyangiaceae bacterium]|nr:SEC-C domain-containing protein [Polyangiaceae bacterium]
MGHDHHFLSRLDRVGWADCELALTLYRDHELVRVIINASSLPRDATRVAISLRDPEVGPFVVVQQDGHFVTCLGHGMRTRLPVMHRDELDHITRDMAAFRAASAKYDSDAEYRLVVARLFRDGSLLAREDIAALRAVQPAICLDVVHAYCGLLIELNRALAPLRTLARSKNREIRRHVNGAYRLMWVVRNLAIVAGLDSSRALQLYWEAVARSPTGLATHLEQSFCAWTALWMVAQTGSNLLPLYLAGLRGLGDTETHADAVAGLIALAVRYPACRTTVRKALLASQGEGATAFETTMARIALRTLDLVDSGDHVRLADDEARRRVFAHRNLVAPDARTLDEIPTDVALGFTLSRGFNFLADSQSFADFLLIVARIVVLPAEQLCLPRALARQAARLPANGVVLDSLRRPSELRREDEASEPPITTTKRNAPCPCGSGRKTKRCCGGDCRSTLHGARPAWLPFERRPNGFGVSLGASRGRSDYTLRAHQASAFHSAVAS